MMQRARYASLLLLILPGLACVAAAANGFLLVSDAEYARDQTARQVVTDDGRTAGEMLDQEVWTRSIDAPTIEIVTPDAATPVESPVDIMVRFAPGPGATIAPETLRVRYGVIGLDVTERIRKAATVTPEGIRARGAQLPVGDHAMSIEIGDTAGRKTRQKFKFRVAE